MATATPPFAGVCRVLHLFAHCCAGYRLLNMKWWVEKRDLRKFVGLFLYILVSCKKIRVDASFLFSICSRLGTGLKRSNVLCEKTKMCKD